MLFCHLCYVESFKFPRNNEKALWNLPYFLNFWKLRLWKVYLKSFSGVFNLWKVGIGGVSSLKLFLKPKLSSFLKYILMYYLHFSNTFLWKHIESH